MELICQCQEDEARRREDLRDIAHRLRVHSITSTSAAKFGSPTSCATIAEILSVLFFRIMRLNINEPLDPASDRLILSMGRATPGLYAAWAEAGLFSTTLLKELCKAGSNLEGYPTPRLSFIDVSTGPIGEALSIGAGMAYVGKYIDYANYRIYVIIGNAETYEGFVWEALQFAAHYNLDNLCILFEINDFEGIKSEKLIERVEMFRLRLHSFGANVVICNGHDIVDLQTAFHEAKVSKCRPTTIIAKTCIGKDLLQYENNPDFHGKPFVENDSLDVINHIKTLMIRDMTEKLPTTTFRPFPVTKTLPLPDLSNIKLHSAPSYKSEKPVSTCLAYGKALVKIAKNNSRIIAIDADTRELTLSERLRKELPEQFIECHAAQQCLVGVTIGVVCRDRAIVFASTIASFLTRAFYQIRMGAISQTNANFVGSHCGLSAETEGPSHMGLEDIAMFRTIPGSTIFYPSDAVACERAVELAANTKGICYIRTSNRIAPLLYGNREIFQIGKSKIIRKSDEDHILVIGAGLTLHECISSADELQKTNNINLRIMDPFTIKPLDVDMILMHGRICDGLIIVVEDHYKEAGLGEAVLSALAEHRGFIVRHLYVSDVPRSGPFDTLTQFFGISACHISTAAKQIYRRCMKL